ncbi:related to Ferric reductase transmembrane component 1 precursor [Pseudozyma flocculosa]|uniref:Related to Ferric reductase transmembrane component 1 n=1 Tax=Pseudozyma flocculosa TaxID=84751 RepID=A0A5C3F763_9BASI|nr:related to Ferric reductase transmembrane component 1 precursor [Pseudozyma flocculosa]
MASTSNGARLVPRHKEVPGCVWKPGMVGPGCRPPAALRNAAMEGKDSYYDMGRYADTTTWVLLALIAIAILPGLLHRLRIRRPTLARRIVRLPLYSHIAALCRWIGYYHPRSPPPGNRRPLVYRLLRVDRLPALGATLVLLAFSTGLVVWCMAVKPYYRPAEVWGSTPLGVRSGMIAQGIMPFMFILAMKLNPITWLTAISHERLQLYHQWLARLVLLFSLIHTFAFLWQPLHDGGAANLKAWFNYDRVWWTGSVCIALLVWIVASSVGAFRSFSYEFFVVQHILSVVVFLGFLFAHTRDLLQTWRWLWPIVAVWGFSTLWRWSNAMRQSSFGRTRAMVEVEIDDGHEDEDGKARTTDDGAIVRVALNAPAAWTPAQHFFIRFPTLGASQAHPFTILSLASPDPQKESQLVFVARVHRGLTRHLYRHVKLTGRRTDGASTGTSLRSNTVAASKTEKRHYDESKSALLVDRGADSEIELCQLPYSDEDAACCTLRTVSLTLPAVIDGPYGSGCSMASYDAVLLIAGGVGITFCLSILMDLAVRSAAPRSAGGIVTKKVALVWSIPSLSLIPWFTPYLLSSLTTLRSNGIDVELRLHLSRPSAGTDTCIPDEWGTHPGRPDIPALIARFADRSSLVDDAEASRHDGDDGEGEGEGVETMSVCVCGPGGMAADTAHCVSALQRSHVLSAASGLREVYLVSLVGVAWRSVA